MMRSSRLPISSPPRSRHKEKAPALREKWVHAIPLIVFLCFFILWIFSYPVDVEIKNGEIVAVHPVEEALQNDTRIEFLILASAASPLASVTPNVTQKNGTESQID